MTSKNIIYILLLVGTGCASVVSPDGGVKDESAPIVISTTPDSAAINMNSPEIVINFNEYITVGNPQQEWVISPTPEKFPTIQKNNKQLKIKLLDSLIPNTTYTINTANSIADLNEGNVLKNYRFVFSTGPHIDSLRISGKIINAYTCQPQEDVSVMLFDTSKDIFKGNPKYLTKTDKEGNYSLQNLPTANFNIAAWIDKNKNKTPDAEENIALPDSFTLTKDTNVNLKLINSNYRKQGIKQLNHTTPGIFKFITEKPLYLDSLSITFLQFKNNKRNTENTYINPSQDTVQMTIPYDKDIDTVIFTINTIDSNYSIKTAVIHPYDTFKIKQFKNTLDYNDPIVLEFNLPIERVGEIKIINNDGLLVSHEDISINTNTVTIKNKLQIGKYLLILPNNSIKSIFQSSYFKEDTLKFEITENQTLGSLKFIVTDTLHQNILLELISDYKTVNYIQCAGCNRVQFDGINPGNYQIKVIYDSNNNQTWDIGDVKKAIYPEQTTLLKEVYKVKANWQQNDIQLVIPNQQSN